MGVAMAWTITERRSHMPESISELVALLVGLVVLSLLWQSLASSEHAGQGRGRRLRHSHSMKSGLAMKSGMGRPPRA
jgi:hypothetical protein